MKKLLYISILISVLFSACEDPIDVTLDDGERLLVIDGWIDDQARPQEIKLTYSQPYFDNALATGIENASVKVTKDDGTVIDFTHTQSGTYLFDPGAGTIGNVGDKFDLEIVIDDKTYNSSTEMYRTTVIDSIRQEFRDDELVGGDGVYCELMSRDPVGEGDSYWIKTWKNGVYLNRDLEINIAYDAGFDSGGAADGVIFITPIRENINPLTDELLPEVWKSGDTIRVEVHSISNDAFGYMEVFRDQLVNSRNGIFAEPLTNTKGNVKHTNGEDNVLGVFNVAAISSIETLIR